MFNHILTVPKGHSPAVLTSGEASFVSELEHRSQQVAISEEKTVQAHPSIQFRTAVLLQSYGWGGWGGPVLAAFGRETGYTLDRRPLIAGPETKQPHTLTFTPEDELEMLILLSPFGGGTHTDPGRRRCSQKNTKKCSSHQLEYDKAVTFNSNLWTKILKKLIIMSLNIKEPIIYSGENNLDQL